MPVLSRTAIFLRRFITVCAALLLSWKVLWAQTGRSDVQKSPASPKITILHTNDLSGRLRPFKYYEEADRGGAACRATLIKEMSWRGNLLVLDAGDAMGPSVLSDFDQGGLFMEMMNRTGYSAMVLGNHEFDFGREILEQRIEEAEFPILSANITVQGTETPFVRPYVVRELDRVRVAVIGLTSQETQQLTNPKKIKGLTFLDPIGALRKTLVELADSSIHYTIVLSHMRQDETLKLARQVEEIDLIVAGGYWGPGVKGGEERLISLVNGTHIVTTPDFGVYLGKVEVIFSEDPRKGLRPVDFQSELIPVGPEIPEDKEIQSLIVAQEREYDRATRVIIGTVDGVVEDVGGFVANTMRARCGVEIGIINVGGLRLIPLREAVTLKEIDQIIRFEDFLITMKLTGSQIRKLVARSKGMEEENQKLIFAGVDPANLKMNGRPLNNAELYAVVVTEFLSRGGDGYTLFTEGIKATNTWLSLKQVLMEYIQTRWKISASDFDGFLGHPLWKTGSKVTGSLTRTELGKAAEDYRKESISFLRGASAIAWSFMLDGFASYDVRDHNMVLTTKTAFGQIGTNLRQLKESVDRLDMEWVYRYRDVHAMRPFLSLGANTVLTKNKKEEQEKEKRPIKGRSSFGLQRQLVKGLSLRMGASAQRNFFTGENDFGSELVSELKRSLPWGVRVSSTLKSFFGVSGKRVLSAEQYNTLTMKISKNMNLSIHANFFLYRNSAVRDLALKSELNVGLGYAQDWKWF